MSLLGTSKSIWGFDPRSVPGCALWLDAADPASVTGTTTVTAWRDKSGNGRNFSVGSGTTSYASSAVTFSNSYMFVTSAVDLTAFTFFIVSKTNVANYNQIVFGARPNASPVYNSADGFGFYMDSGTQVRLYGKIDTGTQFSLNGVSTSSPNIFAYTSGSTVINSWINGTIGGGAISLGARTGTAQGFAIGGEWNGSSYAYVNIAASIYEIIVYNASLTAAQRQAVEGYLARKWFTSTPIGATHPYYRFQPFLRGFVPTDLPNCSLWLDGADQSSTSMTLASSRLATWKDKSGYGNDFTAAPFATTNPTFSNIGPLLTGPYFAALQARRNTTMTFPKVYTIFCVANQQAAAPGSYAYIMHSPFNADFILFFGTFNATHNFATFNGSGSWNDVASNTPASAVAASPTTASLLCCTNNGSNTATSLVPYFNGVAMTAKNGTNAVAFGMIIGDTSANGTGGASSGNQPWLGGIGEIIIYGSLLTTIQRQQVEGYLASKWGIQGNLAATHPYKTIPAATAAQTINLYDDFVYGPAVTPGYVYGNFHGWTIAGGIGAAGGAFDASPANTYPYYMFIQGNTATGSKAIVPTPGYTATISFSFARRAGGVGGSTVSVTVYFGSTIIYGPTNTPAVGSGWSTVLFTYLMTSAHTSISFVCGVSPATDQSLIIANVSVI